MYTLLPRLKIQNEIAYNPQHWNLKWVVKKGTRIYFHFIGELGFLVQPMFS
jgi:hypothetical protein